MEKYLAPISELATGRLTMFIKGLRRHLFPYEYLRESNRFAIKTYDRCHHMRMLQSYFELCG
ncbi:hypothetical protein EGJ57_23565 [Brucella anthropi]|nr:hypothetical protein EGJ57_23565 [Brucella anthropi]